MRNTPRARDPETRTPARLLGREAGASASSCEKIACSAAAPTAEVAIRSREHGDAVCRPGCTLQILPVVSALPTVSRRFGSLSRVW